MAAKKRKSVRSPFFTRSRSAYREPEVTLGEPKALPESRPEVIAKIVARLEKDGPFRQQYSNGEFISSSLAIARTFEEAKAVETLETTSYVVHHDESLNIYWRRTGSFD